VNETAKSRVDVLVIDDDAIMRELMADWLEAAGYRVHKAEGCGCRARRAQAACAGPGRDRHVHARAVRGRGDRPAESRAARNRSHRGFGYFNSGHGLSAEAALSAGADRALAKPVKRRELIQAVAELVGPPAR